ncbi:pleckstrin homology domain-containing family G member 2-like isoform X2 [Dreissena polymorpha]|uniref:pleckstrin homology domain-containing family G member 2-like isoform X2 n=1 Tax=Dreissena polymorpha TaxID=45954 RepID=UPI002265082D|nr:pleckstrin homology domain-containing family G member 2-like isoform X2 [Dreissena polymorpha]
MAALPQRVKLHRRQAMKRKGFSRAGRSSTLSKIIESRPPSDSSGEDADDEDCRGSSLDLTPTLLGIYDKIASANRNEDQPDGGQSNVFKTNENLEDEENNQCHSPPMLPRIEQKSLSQQKVRELYLQSSLSERVDCNKPSKLRMDNTDSTGEIDNKKRPLSISSMSSSSTSSLPRRSKRPNLSEYVASVTSSKLDIEKLDNLLYIDDEQEHEIPEQSADESSECSDEKRRSGDSDSQTSIDHQDRDQSDLQLQESISLHQSDSILSFTPLNSENCSTVDLSLNSDLTSCESGLDRVQRSPSRSSQRSAAVSRSSSQKSGHYVSYVQRVVSELLETERTYVLNLQDIKQGYYEYLKATQPEHLSTEDLICLFGNILQIYNFSCEFLRQLEMCDLEPIKVAQCFVTNNKGFEIYAEYCTNYPSAVDVLTRVMRDSGLSDLFKQRQLTMGHGLPLGAYLLKPVQRILKYHLLLQNILKHYNKTDDGYDTLVAAHDHMTDMSHHINEMKRKHEHAVRVQEIQSQLEDYEGEDFTRLGELVLEGSFRMIGVKASRQMFLFEKGVIIAKRKEDGMLSCKAFIPCAMLMLVESIPREPLNFQILPIDNPRGAHIIHARNLEQKRKWCQEIKRLMVESYANKIPDNVKALILERLGKSKDEDALAKSGSTDPGKSHVTTPDYLDKRNRTRRKSGPNLLQAIRKTEILRPQKNKKLPGRSKGEASSPKLDIPESALYPKETSLLINSNTEHYGFRNNMPGPLKAANTSTPKENLENLSPSRKSKRPLTLQRSLSFQNSQRGLPTGNPEAHSMENLVNSDGPKIRNPSFRLATQASPIGFDVSEASLRESPENLSQCFLLRVFLLIRKMPIICQKMFVKI